MVFKTCIVAEDVTHIGQCNQSEQYFHCISVNVNPTFFFIAETERAWAIIAVSNWCHNRYGYSSRLQHWRDQFICRLYVGMVQRITDDNWWNHSHSRWHRTEWIEVVAGIRASLLSSSEMLLKRWKKNNIFLNDFSPFRKLLCSVWM